MIGGNVYAKMQVKKAGKKNAIGTHECEWTDCCSLLGWLDLSSGDSKHSTFNAKMQESTHVFLCDYSSLKNLRTGWLWDPFNFLNGVIKEGDGTTVDVTSENARMLVNDDVYEILLIDDPMQMHRQLEIYLKRVGVYHEH